MLTYTLYRIWRGQVVEPSRLVAFEIYAFQPFVQWDAAEQRFVEELEQKGPLPGMEPIREAVAESNRILGPLKSLRPPPNV
jgi:hypothetical protein